MTSFSPSDQKELRDRLNVLRQVCYPSVGLTIPYFKFKKKKDFDNYDFLDFGYPVYPNELKDIWQDRETLRDHNIDYIIAKGKKWFFNTKKIAGDFYSKEGHKKVEIEFPFWMDGENIWKDPQSIEAIRKVLEKCSGHHFPTQQEALSCFPKKLLRQIYDKNPSRPAIEDAVLEMMETLRKKISNHLKTHHLNDVLKDPGFLSYLKKTTFPGNPPDKHKVGTYFSQNKQAMYFLAQKFNLINNAASLMRYEQMRDHLRHPEKVAPLPVDTRKVYRDFEKVIKLPAKGPSRAKTFKTFTENEEIAMQLSYMSEILNLMNFHVDPKLRKKYKKKAYYQDLINKGFLTPDEANLVQQKIRDCNNVAHLNYARLKARKKVINDTALMGLSLILSDRHDKWLQKMQRWAKEESHSF